MAKVDVEGPVTDDEVIIVEGPSPPPSSSGASATSRTGTPASSKSIPIHPHYKLSEPKLITIRGSSSPETENERSVVAVDNVVADLDVQMVDDGGDDGLGNADHVKRSSGIDAPTQNGNSLSVKQPDSPRSVINLDSDDVQQPVASGSKPPSFKSESSLPSLPPSSQPGTTEGKQSKPSSKSNGLAPPSSTQQSSKPKSVRRRSPSPDPVPAPPPQQVKTIRLNIDLGGPTNYSIDIHELAQESGQWEPPSLPTKRDTSDSDGEEEAPKETTSVLGRRRRKKHLAQDIYDTSDPFIDDSELAMDERTFFAQTKQQGFYVSSGEVALLKDRTTRKEKEGIPPGDSPMKKPKSKRSIIPTIIPLAGSTSGGLSASNSFSAPPGLSQTTDEKPEDPFASTLLIPPTPNANASTSRAAPAPTKPSEALAKSVSANGAGVKRKSSETNAGGKKKRKLIEIESFHPDLQAQIRILKEAIAKADWSQKGKFPQEIKPTISDTAVIAIRCGEYDDRFFSLLPQIFPYNKFTMSKLTKRTVFPEHMKMLGERTEVLLNELKTVTDEGFAKAQADYESAVAAWHSKKDQKATMTPSASASGTPQINGGALPAATPGANNGNDSGMDVDQTPPPPTATQLEAGADGAGDEKGERSGEPAKRFRLTERMKNIIWELVVLSNEGVRIENEKNFLENSTMQVSEQGARKTLYQKIVSSFPEGWMTSGQISREVSVMKKRYETQQAEAASAA